MKTAFKILFVPFAITAVVSAYCACWAPHDVVESWVGTLLVSYIAGAFCGIAGWMP